MTVTASGSGPLSSERLSKLSLSELVELKSFGYLSAVILSKSLPLSNTRFPCVSQIENDLAPNEYRVLYSPAALVSGKAVFTFSLPNFSLDCKSGSVNIVESSFRSLTLASSTYKKSPSSYSLESPSLAVNK